MVDTTYETRILNLLGEAFAHNESGIQSFAEATVQCVRAGGVLQAFGSGHSAAIAFELFHRAGGVVCVNLLANAALSPFAGRQSGRLEKVSGVAEALCAPHAIQNSDLGIVATNSGANAVPAEVATYLKSRGCKVVAVLSALHHRAARPAHSILDSADVVLDTRVPPGDAIMHDDDSLPPYGPASIIIGCALVDAAVCRAIRILRRDKGDDFVLKSQNLPGANEYNESLRARYKARIRLF